MIRRLLILTMVMSLAASLAACGRKGNPEEPDNAIYPRDYPYTPLPALTPTKKPATGGGTADEPFQAPQPHRTRPNELIPPAGNPDTSRLQ